MREMKKPPKAAQKGEIRVYVGTMRAAVKSRCALLGITMQDGVLEALALWLKEGRRKAA